VRLGLKRGKIQVRVRGNMTALVWKDKQDIHTFTNMHNPPAEVNFCDEHGNAIKPTIMEEYSKHTSFVDKMNRMAKSYSISCQT
jgi:hypothetical protein